MKPAIRIAIVLMLVTPARVLWADAATHVLELKAADERGERISRGRYDTMCVVRGRLRSVSVPSPDVSVTFWYRGHPGLDRGAEAAIGLQFGPLSPGAASEWVRADVASMRCRQIEPHRIAISCSPSCGFVHVQLPALRAPRLTRQKVTAENQR